MSIQSNAVKQHLSSRRITLAEVSEMTGISITHLSNMINGHRMFSKKAAQALHEQYGFNIQYLITGEGSLLLPDSYRKVGQANGSTFTLGDNSPISLDKEAMYQEKIATLQDQVDTLKRTNEALLRCLENKA